jgi:hypothetical protein
MAHYTISPERTTAAKATVAARRVAVFIAHGMGQQIPFETLDALAEGLRTWDEKQGNAEQQPAASAVKTGDQWLSRIALQLKAGTVETHVYEAYWAPMTEGRVTIRDVTRFLVGAGLNGLRNASGGRFKRWVLNKDEEYPIPVRALLFLLTTLAVVLSLVVMNAAIVAVAAGLSFLGHRPDWLTPNLLADLTTTFNVVVTAIILTAATLAISILMHRFRWPRRLRVAWSWFPTLPVFIATLFVIISSGVAVLLLFYGHVRVDPNAGRYWHHVFSPSGINDFDHNFAVAAWWLAVVGAAAILGKGLWDVLNASIHDLADAGGRVATTVFISLFVLLLVTVGWLIWKFIQQFQIVIAAAPLAAAGAGVGWVLLALSSAFVRSLLVQFVGDVAVYVMPYGVDAFNDLRREIKDKCTSVANAVYSMRDAQGTLVYDHVIVVGHSLGSVIAYDVLNQLIREDGANNDTLNVVGRTPLFLTFGSPLDKTAFIFAVQGRHTTEAREALAATVQPMLQAYERRPKTWINVHSGWDIISGHLDFYDPPKPDPEKRVQNHPDPDATSLLVAHTEYWKNDTVIRAIYDAI